MAIATPKFGGDLGPGAMINQYMENTWEWLAIFFPGNLQYI